MPAFEYDAHETRRPKRAKRISAYTGKPTGLNPEAELQIACVAYYDKRCQMDPTLRRLTRLYAVGAAEGNIPQHLRILMKRMGKRAGVFDLHFFDKRQAFQYSWIEMKVGRNDYTLEQVAFVEWLSDTPVRCVQARTLNEFISIIGG